jgi:hypothetical protein
MVLGSAVYARWHNGGRISASALDTGAFAASTSLEPVTATPGAVVAIRATVTSRTSAVELVDLEVHDGSGRKVFQAAFDGQAFSPGSRRTYVARWAVPEGAGAGVYRLTVGIFRAGWTGLVYWSDNSAIVAITPAPAAVSRKAPG